MQNPGIGTVLHCRPPNVHIFGTYPCLLYLVKYSVNWVKCSSCILLVANGGCGLLITIIGGLHKE